MASWQPTHTAYTHSMSVWLCVCCIKLFRIQSIIHKGNVLQTSRCVTVTAIFIYFLFFAQKWQWNGNTTRFILHRMCTLYHCCFHCHRYCFHLLRLQEALFGVFVASCTFLELTQTRSTLRHTHTDKKQRMQGDKVLMLCKNSEFSFVVCNKYSYFSPRRHWWKMCWCQRQGVSFLLILLFSIATYWFNRAILIKRATEILPLQHFVSKVCVCMFS